MGFCELIEKTLGYKTGVYDTRGIHLDGIDPGYKHTQDILYEDNMTYIRNDSLIICVEGRLSHDSCALIRLICQKEMGKQEHGDMQSLEYILKNEVARDRVRGKYTGYTAMYIRPSKGIRDFIEGIFEDVSIELVEDENALYLLVPSDEDEQEGCSIIKGLMEEKGISVLIGAGRVIGGSYTVKDSAEHARISWDLAYGLGYKSGFFHIDKMAIYGLMDSISEDKETFFLHGGYGGFSEVFMDSELIKTSEELLKCNLNISEAARNLYIHRNTLLYRLEKIKALTGLDIKRFEDAFIFRTIIIIYKFRGSL
jgi:hypothetical protein